jgi:hypothetical protein
MTIEFNQNRGSLWITISCDTCGVWQRFEHPIGEAIIAMKAKGWRRDNARHKCLECTSPHSTTRHDTAYHNTPQHITRELLLEGLDG